jgi:hypothetical protein
MHTFALTEASSARTASYSTCVTDAVLGPQQSGIVHSAFASAANILFPDDFLLSLNAGTSPRMPNGIQLPVLAGTFPFSLLRPAMPVLLGAGQLIIDAIDYALDLSYCPQWNPHIQLPETLDVGIVRKNGAWLASRVGHLNDGNTCNACAMIAYSRGKGLDEEVDAGALCLPVLSKEDEEVDGGALCLPVLVRDYDDVDTMARYLCGRGVGLTPSGDDMLAGWMALHWLLYGPEPHLIAACQRICEIASVQTHILSQCWLGYAAQGDVALPVRDLLIAMTKEDNEELEISTQAVLAMGATSGYDLIHGILSGLNAADTCISLASITASFAAFPRRHKAMYSHNSGRPELAEE